MRELRNQGGKVLDRARDGELITITRDGEDVAELKAVNPRLSAENLTSRWRHLPAVDPAQLRQDLDQITDPGL